MMRTMPPAERIPPFERFYLAHREEVLRYLRKLLGPRAEDAWQETFLRALRAYDRLEHGRHLRAWVFTIATNVAMDQLRPRASANLAQAPEPAVELRRDAFKELEHLTDGFHPRNARPSCSGTATTSATPRSPTRSAPAKRRPAPQLRPESAD